MFEATAPKAADDADRLTLLFVIYNARLVRHLRARLGPQWELAEDLAQETWARVTKDLGACRASDDRAFPWICRIAQRATFDHFRLARSTRESATDFTGPAAGSLPPAPAAEDVAIANGVVLAMLAETASPLEVAA
ncbi:RNA polymerase sigma factor [Streptomyces xantholiticus]